MPEAEATASRPNAIGHSVFVLLGTLVLIRIAAMFVVPLMDTTEARYGEIARKMAELNDWVTLWFDYGVPYWGKPPLSFWLTAGSLNLFGVSEFAARLPHFLMSLAVIGLAAWMASRREPQSIWPTIIFLAAAPVFFVTSGLVMMDIELTFGVTLSMAGFWIALEAPEASHTGRRTAWLPNLLFFIGLAVGLLSKGPVALVLIAMPLFFWTALHSRWRDVWRRLYWIPGMLLTALIALPWYIAAEQSTPGFLRYFLIGEHFLRFIEPGWAGDQFGNAHTAPIGAIWVHALGGLLPWSILIPIAIWRWREPGTGLTATFLPNIRAASSGENQWRSYLLFWAVAPLLLFTLARNVGWSYVLPGIPALAIWAGQWLTAEARKGHNTNRVLGAGMLITLAILLGAAAVWSQPETAQRKSVKALLAAYETSRSAQAPSSAADQSLHKPEKTAAPLIFVRRRPFSAEFYTRGKALLADDSAEAWSRIGANAAYVAVIDTEIFLGAAEAGKRSIRRLGRYGRFDLLFVEPL